MREPIRKKRPGQAGGADTSAFVRQDRIELRVNQQEKIRIAQLAKERGFDDNIYLESGAPFYTYEQPIETLRQWESLI